MPLVLNPQFALTRHPKSIVLHDARLVGRGRKLLQRVSAGDAFLLALYDGVRTTSDVVHALKLRACSDEMIRAAIDTTRHFARLGVLIDTGALSPNVRFRRYDARSFAFDAEVQPPGTRLEQPIGINYIVSRKCSLACRYCYAGATPNVAEKLLSLPRLFEIIDDAANLKVSTINVSGGEPFEHPGIFEILKHIIDRQIYPVISTKAC